MISACKQCGAEFKYPPSHRRLYCTRACYDIAKPTKTHGLSHTPEWDAWKSMRNRCNNPQQKNYPRYGGRGIIICERWNEFENFLADMGQRPGKGHSIDRINNDGNYEPANCRWATAREQVRNRSISYTPEEDRKIREAVALGYSLKQISEYVGKSFDSVTMRTYRIGLKSGKGVATPLEQSGSGK